MGYARVLFETGLTFLNHLLKKRSIHDLYIFKSGKILGKNGRNNFKSLFLKNIVSKLLTINLNGDKLFRKQF